jgi:hypothetical protein
LEVSPPPGPGEEEREVSEERKRGRLCPVNSCESMCYGELDTCWWHREQLAPVAARQSETRTPTPEQARIAEVAAERDAYNAELDDNRPLIKAAWEALRVLEAVPTPEAVAEVRRLLREGLGCER